MTAPATQHLKALYGLKFNPFGQDVPRDALLCSPRVDDFGWRLVRVPGHRDHLDRSIVITRIGHRDHPDRSS